MPSVLGGSVVTGGRVVGSPTGALVGDPGAEFVERELI